MLVGLPPPTRVATLQQNTTPPCMIQPDHRLTLDIYSEDDEGEQYNFRYIIVDIQEDIIITISVDS